MTTTAFSRSRISVASLVQKLPSFAPGKQPFQQTSLANEASPSYTSHSAGRQLPARELHHELPPQPPVDPAPFQSGPTQPDQQPICDANGQQRPLIEPTQTSTGPTQPDQQPICDANGQQRPLIEPTQTSTGRQPIQQASYANQASSSHQSPSAGWQVSAQQLDYDRRFQPLPSVQTAASQSASTKPDQQPSSGASGQPQPSIETAPPPTGFNLKQPIQQHDANVVPQPVMQYVPLPTGWQPPIAGQLYVHYVPPPGAFQHNATFSPTQASTLQQQPPAGPPGWKKPAQQYVYNTMVQSQPSMQQPSMQYASPPAAAFQPPLPVSHPQATTVQKQPPPGSPGAKPIHQASHANQTFPSYTSPSAGWRESTQQPDYGIRFRPSSSLQTSASQSVMAGSAGSIEPNQQPLSDASGQPQPSIDSIPPPADSTLRWQQLSQQHDARVVPQPFVQYAPLPTGWQAQIVGGQPYMHYTPPPGGFQYNATPSISQAATQQQQPPAESPGFQYNATPSTSQAATRQQQPPAQPPGSNFGGKQAGQQPFYDTMVQSQPSMQYTSPLTGWQQQITGQSYIYNTQPPPTVTSSPPEATTMQRQQPLGSPGRQRSQGLPEITSQHGKGRLNNNKPSVISVGPMKVPGEPLGPGHSFPESSGGQYSHGKEAIKPRQVAPRALVDVGGNDNTWGSKGSEWVGDSEEQNMVKLACGDSGLDYGSKVELLFKQNKLEEIDGMYIQMKASQVHVSAKTYGTILQSYLQLGKMDKVAQIYQEMSGVLFAESKERDENVEVTLSTGSTESSTVSLGPLGSGQDAQPKMKNKEDGEHLIPEIMAATGPPNSGQDAQLKFKKKEELEHMGTETMHSPLYTQQKGFSLFGHPKTSIERGMGRGTMGKAGPSESRVGRGPPYSGQDSQLKPKEKEDGEPMIPETMHSPLGTPRKKISLFGHSEASLGMGMGRGTQEKTSPSEPRVRTVTPNSGQVTQLKTQEKEDGENMIPETIHSRPFDTQQKGFSVFGHSEPSVWRGMGRGTKEGTHPLDMRVGTGPPTFGHDVQLKTKEKEDGGNRIPEMMQSPLEIQQKSFSFFGHPEPSVDNGIGRGTKEKTGPSEPRVMTVPSNSGQDAQLETKEKEDRKQKIPGTMLSAPFDTQSKSFSLFGHSEPSVGRGTSRGTMEKMGLSEPRVGTGRGRGQKMDSLFNFDFSGGLRSADEQSGSFAKPSMQSHQESKTEVQDEYSQTFTPVIQPGWYAFAPEGVAVGPGAGRGRPQSPQTGSVWLGKSPAAQSGEGELTNDLHIPAAHQQRPPLYSMDSRSSPLEQQYADPEEQQPFQSTLSAEETEAAAEQAMKILTERRISRFKNMFEYDENVVKRSPLGLARSLGERKQPKKTEEVGKAIRLTKEEEKEKTERLKAIEENEALQELHHTFDQFMKFYGEMAVEPEHELGDFTNPDIEEKPFISLEEYLEKAKPNIMKTGLISSDKEWEHMVKDTMRHVPYYEEFVERYGGPGRYTAKQENEDLEEIAGTLPSDVGRAAKSFVQRSLTTLKSNPGLNLQQKQWMLASMVDEFSQYIVND